MKKPCAACSKPAASKRCGRCKLTTYCSVACQRKHWKEHKTSCRKPTSGVDGSLPPPEPSSSKEKKKTRTVTITTTHYSPTADVPFEQRYSAFQEANRLERVYDAKLAAGAVPAAAGVSAEELIDGALARRRMCDYGGAISLLRKALEVDPRSSQAYHDLGWTLNRGMDDFDGALAAYEKALEIDPAVKTFMELGMLRRKIGDFPGAIACYENGLKLDASSTHLYVNLGNALDDSGDTDGAIAAYNKALEIDPKCSDAWKHLGITIGNKKGVAGLDEAIALYEKAVALDPNPQSEARMLLKKARTMKENEK